MSDLLEYIESVARHQEEDLGTSATKWCLSCGCAALFSHGIQKPKTRKTKRNGSETLSLRPTVHGFMGKMKNMNASTGI